MALSFWQSASVHHLLLLVYSDLAGSLVRFTEGNKRVIMKMKAAGPSLGEWGALAMLTSWALIAGHAVSTFLRLSIHLLAEIKKERYS